MDDLTGGRCRLSDPSLRFIGRWEGFRGKLYNDTTGNCTIGYGHLVHLGRCNGSEPDWMRRGITRQRGLELLRADAQRFADGVCDRVRINLRQHEFDALVSFAFNVGINGFGGSTLLKKLNRGDKGSVPSELMRWTSGGIPGLVNRRRAEGVLFSQGRYRLVAGSTGSAPAAAFQGEEDATANESDVMTKRSADEAATDSS